MVSFNYENLNYVMSQFLKLSCVSFSYVSISYVLAILKIDANYLFMKMNEVSNSVSTAS